MENEESTVKKGKQGEDAAVAFLEAKGLTILERNWHCSHKEVDIIAEDGKYIAFIEVKTRKTVPTHLDEVITKSKMQNLLSAASYYIKTKRLDKECRFDVMILTGSNGKYDINYMPGAFRSYLR